MKVKVQMKFTYFGNYEDVDSLITGIKEEMIGRYVSIIDEISNIGCSSPVTVRLEFIVDGIVNVNKVLSYLDEKLSDNDKATITELSATEWISD